MKVTSSRAGTLESHVTESAYNTCHTLGSSQGKNLFSPDTESSPTERECLSVNRPLAATDHVISSMVLSNHVIDRCKGPIGITFKHMIFNTLPCGMKFSWEFNFAHCQFLEFCEKKFMRISDTFWSGICLSVLVYNSTDYIRLYIKCDFICHLDQKKTHNLPTDHRLFIMLQL